MKKQREQRKLVLSRETVRQIRQVADDDLRNAHGGAPYTEYPTQSAWFPCDTGATAAR